jgi:hypothetical protein
VFRQTFGVLLKLTPGGRVRTIDCACHGAELSQKKRRAVRTLIRMHRGAR